MIHTKENFYNKVTTEVRSRYFENEVHGTTVNQNYWKATKAIEDFNNGILTYKIFIGRLAKATQTNNATIHNLVEKHIVSFGSYQYKSGIAKTKQQIFSNKLNKNHREILLDELVKAKDEIELGKSESNLEFIDYYKDWKDIKLFLLKERVELIEKTLINNEL